MYCPVCKDKELVMSERQSIEIDYCPGCRGVWLDRGELDKIIQKSVQDQVADALHPTQTAREPEYQPSHHSQHSRHGDNRYRTKKKESFWQELFD
ncbi:TFIIB-type zinc ribbon-containing protein [Glaciimonas soli]|uniref:Transcription factor zinc-finger domain-containing protein n=1 Tax=Glaciimonas soli TaxID=2590999 RepID=A0A843YSC8_9BURK|nr:zf-TFIIB domain-containing protein [Glaciimonas soli]MQR00463.1 hypothetical protein [Glaciimonas soli]